MLVNIYPINITAQDYGIVKPLRNNLNLYINKDIIHFCSNATGLIIPEDIKLETIGNISKNTLGVRSTNNSGYLAEIYKYESPESKKIYAIKKARTEEARRHSGTNPIKQLNDEIKVYKQLGKMNGIPELYGYSDENDADPNRSHFMILEWVGGEPVSKDGTYYRHEAIDETKLGRIFDLISQFDIKGVLHNDLWAANILFTDKGVNIIDFNRAQLFNSSDCSKTNLNDFKERFLWRYLSDVNEKEGETVFLEKYKTTLNLESKILRKRALSELSKGHVNNCRKLINESINLKNLKGEKVKEKALNEIFKSDIRCGKIYTKHFQLAEDEAVKAFEKAKKIRKDYPDIISYDQDFIDLNLETISGINKAMDFAQEKKPQECYETFKEVSEKLDKYPAEEKQEDYYKQLSKFTEININFLDRFLNKSSEDASSFLKLDENQNFFKYNKIITYYRDILEDLTKLDKNV